MSDDEFPSVQALLGQSRGTNSMKLRRSPRKPTAPQNENTNRTAGDRRMEGALPNTSCTSKKSSRAQDSHSEQIREPTKTARLMDNIPLLPRNPMLGTEFARSNNRSSPQSRPVMKLTHVDSLLLPLSKLAMERRSSEDRNSRHSSKSESTQYLERKKNSNISSKQTPASTRLTKTSHKSTNRSRFILTEARCNDDDEDSRDEEDDEDTDLSGFIVDDNADLSFYESSDAEVKNTKARIKKRLVRGGRWNEQRQHIHKHQNRGASEDDSEKENNPNHDLSSAMETLRFDPVPAKHKPKQDIDIIDLTSSPERSNRTKHESCRKLFDGSGRTTGLSQVSLDSDLCNDFDNALRLFPPRSKSPIKSLRKSDNQPQNFSTDDFDVPMPKVDPEIDHFTTPPVTPPRSPSKLKSPSKLLSPSKNHDPAPRSPHRQSMDAFWDLNTINEWTDQYSPKKAPILSPGKRGLAMYQTWSDSEDESEEENSGSSASLPSPCSSPRKGRSPMKSPEKAEKKRLADERKVVVAKKKAFMDIREQLANDLLNELDTVVTGSQISKLAASTGGVQVIWSKTLRSTAGRANWRRTVTKLSGSPIKGAVSEDPGVKIQHFANIELAEKVIDCDDRLVNTLAHEFCHLANFMVSGVRDQPHGTSFKAWAAKVTKHLRSSKNEVWSKVEVTTKHSYVINHKYLWVCGGKEMTKAMEFVNIENEDDGCGAEYGRHSKSIDVEKHRCGNCKGRLVQVRPKPRASPAKKSSRTGTGIVGLEKMIEIVELSD